MHNVKVALKRKEILTPYNLVGFEDIMLRERNKSQTSAVWFCFSDISRVADFVETKSKLGTAKVWRKGTRWVIG